MRPAATRHYADAGRCGFALGLVLLASFVLAGRGLGASGAFAAVAGETLGALGVEVTDPGLADRMPSGVALVDDWIVLEILGVMIGGALSAWLAGRLRFGGRRENDAGLPLSRERRQSVVVVPDKRAKASADPEPGVVPSRQMAKSLVGGALMGLGARLAYGCTSGLALSGGALMATGAWVFIPIAFGTAMTVTLLAARRLSDA
jgi:uncharacterized membrane protein YedE/YeeE